MRRRKLRQWKWVRATVYLLLELYAFGSQVLIPWNDWREVFPLFHWSLFSGESRFQTLYEIQIQPARVEIKSPCFVWQCEFGQEPLRTKRFFDHVQAFGRSLDAGQTDREAKRQVVEKWLVRSVRGAFAYTIFRTQVDLIAFARDQSVLSRTEIERGHFSGEAR